MNNLHRRKSAQSRVLMGKLDIQKEGKVSDTEIELPEWASKFVDEYNNVECKTCKRVISYTWRECIYCCKHDELTLTEEYRDGWTVSFECSCCGSDLISNSELVLYYKAVKKESKWTIPT